MEDVRRSSMWDRVSVEPGTVTKVDTVKFLVRKFGGARRWKSRRSKEHTNKDTLDKKLK